MFDQMNTYPNRRRDEPRLERRSKRRRVPFRFVSAIERSDAENAAAPRAPQRHSDCGGRFYQAIRGGGGKSAGATFSRSAIASLRLLVARQRSRAFPRHRRAAALASADTIEACGRQIEKPMEPPGVAKESRETMEAGGLDNALYRFKRGYVANVIAATSGNLTKAAQILKKHPRGLARLLDSLDLSHLKHTPRDRFGTA
jgi:hypothetical protein